jgi:hypothetical protein
MMKLTHWIAGSTLAAFCAAPAFAGTYYTWTTEDDVVSYTNNSKRIPAKYRDSAKQQSTGSLQGYKQYTPSQKADGSHASRLSDRLEHLRAASAAPAVSSAPEGTGVTLDFGSVELQVPGDADASEPITVEEVRVRDRGHTSSRTVQVIRRGDKVISVIAPEHNDNDLSFLPSTSELLRRR